MHSPAGLSSQSSQHVSEQTSGPREPECLFAEGNQPWASTLLSRAAEGAHTWLTEGALDIGRAIEDEP